MDCLSAALHPVLIVVVAIPEIATLDAFEQQVYPVCLMKDSCDEIQCVCVCVHQPLTDE